MPTLTATQRRAAARAEYDAFLAACPSRQVLDRISDKWVTLVLVALADGPLRYSDLSRTIAGVSQKMLTRLSVHSSAMAWSPALSQLTSRCASTTRSPFSARA
jgi:HxlR-like helix-turn-helix